MTRQNLMSITARVGVTVSLSRMLRGAAVVVLALSAGGVLAGCTLAGDGAQSGQSSASGQSGAADTHAGAGEIAASGTEQAMSTPAETVMSGEYEVGPDGKLLNPNKDLTPPQVPELAKEHSKEGAEALASYYPKLAIYMHSTGDVAPMRKIAHSECEYCATVEKRILRLHDDGGWVKPVVNEFASIGPTFEIPDHPGIWNVDINHLHSVTMLYDGETLEEADETIEKIHIQMQYEGGQWRLWAVGQ